MKCALLFVSLCKIFYHENAPKIVCPVKEKKMELSLSLCLVPRYCIFQTIRCTFPPQIWQENGGASYSLNVAYLACWVG